METLFVNQCVKTEALYKEVFGYFFWKRPLMCALHIILILEFVASIVLKVLAHTNGLQQFEHIDVVILLIVFFFVWRYIRYRRVITVTCERDLEAHGKEIGVTMTVTNECVQAVATNGSTHVLDFSNLKRVAKTKNTIVLQSKANLFYVFSSNGFEKGTKDGFIAFLREKGFRV